MKVAGTQVEGLGFSIPANIVHKVVSDIEKYGVVKRPFIGIHPISMNKLHTEDKLGLGVGYLDKGIYVNDVIANSPAKKAGIEIDDIIVKINNEDIKDVTDFRLKLYKLQIGDEIILTYIRGNKALDVKMNLEAKTQ